jgi:hypothetical protein
MRFGKFLKNVFISNLGIKVASLFLAFLVVLALNI